MNPQERLEQAVTIGDRLADMVRSLAPNEGQEAAEVLEQWDLHTADCVRAGKIVTKTEPEGFEEQGS